MGAVLALLATLTALGLPLPGFEWFFSQAPLGAKKCGHTQHCVSRSQVPPSASHTSSAKSSFRRFLFTQRLTAKGARHPRPHPRREPGRIREGTLVRAVVHAHRASAARVRDRRDLVLAGLAGTRGVDQPRRPGHRNRPRRAADLGRVGRHPVQVLRGPAYHERTGRRPDIDPLAIR